MQAMTLHHAGCRCGIVTNKTIQPSGILISFWEEAKGHAAAYFPPPEGGTGANSLWGWGSRQ